MKRALFFISIACFWLLMMGLHIRREFFQASAVQSGYQVLPIFLDLREEYAAILLGKEQIGFNFFILENKKEEGQDYYELRHQTYLSFLFLGQEREMLIRGKAKLDKRLNIREFDIKISSSDYWTQIAGQAAADHLDLILQSNEGEPIRRSVPIKGPLFYSEAVRFMWTPDNLVTGKQGTIETWNPLLGNLQTVSFHVKEKKPVDHLGKSVEAYLIEINSGGIITASQVSAEGEVLREESATGFSTVQKEGWQIFDVMREKKTPLPDLPNLFSVPSNIPIQDPSALKSMTVKIKNDSLEEIRSLISNDLSGLEKTPLPVPVNTAEFSSYLESTPAIQADDPAVSEKAKVIIEGSSSALEASRKLLNWVHGNISPVPSLSLPQARQVLGVRKGDCNEYTVLFTAFARAVGIPARMNAGLVYHNGRFFYHAWSEIYLGRWVAADPTFAQLPADVTHISLTQGSLEEQVKLVTQLGKVKIEVLDSKY